MVETDRSADVVGGVCYNDSVPEALIPTEPSAPVVGFYLYQRYTGRSMMDVTTSFVLPATLLVVSLAHRGIAVAERRRVRVAS